ncbi:MAG: rhodanese [Phycisphaerales bacterium]|nr:rhodanese [Phycisphaerales bacterium]
MTNSRETPPRPEGLPIGLPAGYPFNPEWEIAPREFQQLRRSGTDLVLIDCRTLAERELARIEGSIHVPMQSLADRLSALRKYETSRVVVHCHHGVRSLQVTQFLRQAGFDDVRSLAGGIQLWSTDIDPSVPIY